MSQTVSAIRKTILFFALGLSLLLTGTARAEQLPLRLYTSADGLASSAITNVFRDSRGFLWFSSRDGLSRFDGREFVNYRIDDNSSAQTFWAVQETRDGAFWFSTISGLYRVKPDSSPVAAPEKSDNKPGEAVRLNAEKVFDISPSVLFEDSSGRLWGCGGDLFLIAENGTVNLQKIELGVEARGSRQNPAINWVTETADGSLWFSLVAGVSRRLPDGRFIHYPIHSPTNYQGSFIIRADFEGRIWVGHSEGLFVFVPEPLNELAAMANFDRRELPVSEQTLQNAGKIPLPQRPGVMFKFKTPSDASNDDSESLQVSGVFTASDGKIWVSAGDALFVIENDSYRRLRDTNGFPAWTGRIVEDDEGNLWIGSSGVLRLARAGLTSYGAVDGLRKTNIQGIQQADGTIYFLHGVDWNISRLTESGFESTRLRLPESAQMLWTSNAALIDERGDWWALAENGLYRFAANEDLNVLGRQQPLKVYGVADGAQGNSFYCAFKDSRGNLWFSTRGRREWSGLTKYDPQTGKFQSFTAADGFPETASPASFAEDAAGNLWFGLYSGGLLRYDSNNGRFTDFSKAEGLPQGSIFGLYIDEKERLWIGSSRDGVARVDNPSAEKLEFILYTTADGLASNNIRALTGDAFGNIYAGTVRGVSRIEPATGRVKNYTTADGLAADFVTCAFRDRDGNLWFGTTNGISRLVPERMTREHAAPPIFISGVRIAGVRYATSEFGQREVGKIEVGSSQNNLQIDFVSVGGDLRYQYRLEGSTEQDWSAPGEQRTVNFANLAPGEYRFLVRAVNREGKTSEAPAVVAVKINPPFWQRWEFIAAMILLVGAAVFALDRYRVAKTRQVEAALADLQRSERERREIEAALQKSREERLAELERVRARIATDLHDDIGSSLTQIAVLSQVAHSQLATEHNSLETPLQRISTVSIELVNAMSDIVWAINPRKDNLRDLVQRMRRFAADVFSARGVKFEFVAPDVENKLQLGANIRREVFAIFKEAVNNTIKHSGCTRAEISLKIVGDFLLLQISDNGAGFDSEQQLHQSQPPTGSFGGNGLINLRKRGTELGGRCEIISFPGGGTTVLLEIPLHYEKTTQAAGDTNGANGLH